MLASAVCASVNESWCKTHESVIVPLCQLHSQRDTFSQESGNLWQMVGKWKGAVILCIYTYVYIYIYRNIRIAPLFFSLSGRRTGAQKMRQPHLARGSLGAKARKNNTTVDFPKGSLYMYLGC